MLIRACDTTINVTRVDKIVLQYNVTKTKKRVHLFKVVEEEKATWDCIMYYRDMDGRDTSFRWHGADNKATVEAIQMELLKQIKEVELESVSTALEDAIRSN
jgi:hypothetical protein